MGFRGGLANSSTDGVLRFVGTFNLFFAFLGLISFVVTLNAYHFFSAWWARLYGPSIKEFRVASIAQVLIVLALAYPGVQMLRHRRRAVILGIVLFLLEIACFAVLWATWSLPFSPLSLAALFTGSVNPAVALQTVTAYPRVGVVLLYKTYLQVDRGSG